MHEAPRRLIHHALVKSSFVCEQQEVRGRWRVALPILSLLPMDTQIWRAQWPRNVNDQDVCSPINVAHHRIRTRNSDGNLMD